MAVQPTFTDLLDHAEGRLTAERAEWVEREVAADEEIARTLAWIVDFLDQARLLPLVSPPPELSAQLRAMFGTGEVRGADQWTTAHLLNQPGTAVAGVRSAATEHHHLAFDSPAGRFIVEVRPAGPDQVDLSGVVLLDAGGAASLTFLEDGVVRAVTRSGRDGHFELSAVSRAVDELHLVAADVRLRAHLSLRGE